MTDKKALSRTQIKKMAQDLIMDKIALVGYGDSYDEFKEEVGDDKAADKILKEQMDRVAKMFGFKEAWFY